MTQPAPCHVAPCYERYRLFICDVQLAATSPTRPAIVALRNGCNYRVVRDRGLDMPHLFISHSSKDELAAEAMRIHLVQRGWNRKEIFLDFSVEGIFCAREVEGLACRGPLCG